MPVVLPVGQRELEKAWQRSASAYAHTVGLQGSHSLAAREAWAYANAALDELVDFLNEDHKQAQPAGV